MLAAPDLELEHAGRDALEEPAVVRDEQDERSSAASSRSSHSSDAQVEVVRRLVEQQQVGLRRERAGQRCARQLAAGEGAAASRSASSTLKPSPRRIASSRARHA